MVFLRLKFSFIYHFFFQFIGIERETTPFVLTREMVYVMGGQNSDLFQTFCVSIFFFSFLFFASLIFFFFSENWKVGVSSGKKAWSFIFISLFAHAFDWNPESTKGSL